MLFHRLGATMMVQVVQPSVRRPRFRIFVCLALIGLAAGGFAYWHYSTNNSAEATRRPPAVPVTVANVATQDVPIYLTGLGIVQASNTTTLHTQVDGKLQTVNFTEGRMVRRGDVLAQIDPRLYQAALDQAKAKKAQDEAQLISASKDLERIQSLVASAAGTQQNLDRQIAVVAQVKATIQADQAA